MYTVKVLSGGRIRLPETVRERYDLKEGVQIKMVDHDGVFVVIPPAEWPAEVLRGKLEEGLSLTEDLLDSRSEDKEKEEQENG